MKYLRQFAMVLQSTVYWLRGLVAVLLPAVTGMLIMLGVWAVTRNRRRALNVMTVWIGELACRMAGIKLFIEGRERLRQRPAVFVFNHRSSVDPVILCQLLRHDVAAVAKMELRYNPVIGPLLGLGETVFVDRAGSPGSVRRALQTLQKGRSLVIAPEGTRSRDKLLRPFKIGAFRIAKMAGLPVIPIVIHDADRVASPGSLAMRSNVVHVEVLAPVDTNRWNESDLQPHMETVELAMREALERAAEHPTQSESKDVEKHSA